MLKIRINKFPKKYKLAKITGTILITTNLLLSLNNLDKEVKEISFTSQDLVDNEIFSIEMNNLSNEEISFRNKEIESIINASILPLKYIKKLTIDTIVPISSFNDLKYLSNLEHLTIENQTIDLSELKYNQKLKSLTLENCTLSNINDLPNSLNNVSITSCEITDSHFKTPYYLKELNIINSVVNHLIIKNPDILKKVRLNSHNYINLESFKDCQNLEVLSITRSTNINNVESLTTLPNLKIFYVDDYASIWLTQDLFNQLPIYSNEDNKLLKKELIDLDNLTNTLIFPNMTDEEKLKSLLLYILEKYNYNEHVSNNDENKEVISRELNKRPIYNSLYVTEDIICINYSCLLTALCNRAGLNNFQYFSENHTWNKVNENILDPTSLDGNVRIKATNNDDIYYELLENSSAITYIEENKEDELAYYNIDSIFLKKYYNTINETPFTVFTHDIGYIHNYEENIKKEELLIKLSKLNSITIHSTLLLLYLYILTKKEKNKLKELNHEEYTLKKEKNR